MLINGTTYIQDFTVDTGRVWLVRLLVYGTYYYVLGTELVPYNIGLATVAWNFNTDEGYRYFGCLTKHSQERLACIGSKRCIKIYLLACDTIWQDYIQCDAIKYDKIIYNMTQ